MNRKVYFLVMLVLLSGALGCNHKAGKWKKQAHSDTAIKAIDTTGTGQPGNARVSHNQIDFSKPFYLHYKGTYLGHKADLDLTSLRNSIFFTLCYYPKYQIVSGVVNHDNHGFQYDYVNKFGDTLEHWDARFIDSRHLRLHVINSTADTVYNFVVDFSSSFPLNVYLYDTVLSMPGDTSKELLLIKLTSINAKGLKFDFMQDLRGLKKEAQDNIDNVLKMIKSYSKDELEMMFFPFNVDRLINVEYNNNGLLVVSANEYDYMGGAHGNNYLSFYNIDTKAHRVLDITDIVDTVGLAKMIWDRLDDKDMLFVDESSIYVPKNYFVKGRKVIFVYNTYEIAPYVMGSISVDFDFADIRERLKQDFIEKFYPGIEL